MSGGWEIRVHELPAYEFVYSGLKDSPSEEDFADPDRLHEDLPGPPQVIEGLIKIQRQGRYGFCDRYGRPALPCDYDYAGQFEKGLCVVSRGGRYGLVDCRGEVVPPIHPEMIRLYDFGPNNPAFELEGKYLLAVGGLDESLPIPRYPYRHRGWRYLLELDELEEYRPESFWRPSDRFLIRVFKRYGIIDQEGRRCAPLAYDLIRPNGVAVREGRWSLLDPKGLVTISGLQDRIRKIAFDGSISCENQGDFVIAEKRGRPDQVFSKNGLFLCAMPAESYYEGRDVRDRIIENGLVERLSENHYLIKALERRLFLIPDEYFYSDRPESASGAVRPAMGKYGVIQSGGRSEFQQEGQLRLGFVEIIPFIWDRPEDCRAEYWRRLAEKPRAEEPQVISPESDELIGPFVMRPEGIWNRASRKIVCPIKPGDLVRSRGINQGQYQGFTARIKGRWHFVELIGPELNHGERIFSW